jgi:hypothetical protein
MFFPASLLGSIGFPDQASYMFVRMLGWAYFTLCIGYWFGLRASLRGERALGPIWVGIFSNGGAFLYLSYYGFSGAWSTWGAAVQFVGWGSIVATFLITLGLLVYGVKGHD